MKYYGVWESTDSLKHYGVLGMKWGVRRYQNADGTLTKEGRQRARKEYRADNKEAFQKGKQATVVSRAYRYARTKEEKALQKYVNKPTINRQLKYTNKKALAEAWAQQVIKATTNAEKHYDELVSKYGSEAVSSIKRDKTGLINERVHTFGDYVASALGTAASLGGAYLLKTPIAFIFYPSTKNQLGRRAYRYSSEQMEIHKQIQKKMTEYIDKNPEEALRLLTSN